MAKQVFVPTPAQEKILRDASLGTKESSRRAGVPYTTAHSWRVRMGLPTSHSGPHGPMGTLPSTPPETVQSKVQETHKDDTWTITLERSPLQTVEDIIAAYGVDQDLWDVDFCEINRHESFAMPKATGSTASGWERVSTAPIITPLFNTKVRFKRKSRVITAAVEQVRRMIADGAGYMPKYTTIPHGPRPGGSLLVVSLPDAHFGKLCWGEETGYADYDLNIARALYKDTLETLLAKATRRIDNIQKILYVVGHDFLNCDGAGGMTTKGTPQAMDSRYAKVVQAAFQTLKETTEGLSTVAPVEAVIVPGNHDFNSMYLLGLALEGWMQHNKHVTIDNSPNPKKYKEWGVNAFGLVHGNNRRRPGLPLRMATERPDMWSRCWNREWHTGHLHTSKEEEFQGTIVRIMPSLSGTDTYHDDNDYVNNLRRGIIFSYHETEGYDSDMVHTIR